MTIEGGGSRKEGGPIMINGGGSRLDKPLLGFEEKPACKLIGEDGNVFAIIGNACRALKRAGQPEKAKEFQERAFKAHSYDEVLVMLDQYVEVE